MDAKLHHGTTMRNRNNRKRPRILLLAGMVTSVAAALFVAGCASKTKTAHKGPAPVPLNLPQDSTDLAADPQYKPTPEVLSAPPRENTIADTTDPTPPPPPARPTPPPAPVAPLPPPQPSVAAPP